MKKTQKNVKKHIKSKDKRPKANAWSAEEEGYSGMRGATGEAFRGVKNKQESSFGSQHAQAPLCKQSGRADCKRFAHSARPGSEKTWLLEFFFIIGGLCHVWPTFDAQELFGLSKVPQEAPPPKSIHFSGAIWESFFAHLLIWLGMFLSIIP